MDTGMTQNSFYPARITQVNNELLNDENESAISLHNDRNNHSEHRREPLN